MDVLDLHGPVDLLASLRIRRADDSASGDAATGQRDREAVWPVVAARGRIDVRRTAEFAATDDDGLLQQITGAQLSEQCRDCPGSRIFACAA